MSSPTPDSFTSKAEQARKRALRSRRLGYGAALVAAALAAVFIVQGVIHAPPAPPEPPVPEKAQHIAGGFSSFSGIDINNKPFSVKALQGVQDSTDETLMHLKTVTGAFVRREGGEVQVIADNADYELKTKDLMVTGNVRFEEPGRYVAKLSSATVNLERQRIVTKEPVQVVTSGATVSADSMETSEDGKLVILRGHVKAQFAGGVVEK
ncbi:MAG: LPS export ABC transporter periplasmic protein LptC [Pseudomonadota bacterium]|nr:LPS export ABC transporter periplasmic protein LptC [Pseudomonadota bacterium]